ncbi:MAG: DUF721 domain-containing protein [Rhodobacteraceae bacterium]|nr:DUF721 domain-containing protein [Paracoccaceae bacterium]
MPRDRKLKTFGSGFKGGFRSVSALTSDRLQRIAEQKGITLTRLLTAWPEVIGSDIGEISRPVKVSWPRNPLEGGTLVLRIPGSCAQELSMKREVIIERVNKAYGYNAIGRVRFEHTTFADLAADSDDHKPMCVEVKDGARDESWMAVQNVEDKELREALFELGSYILSREKEEKEN